MRKIGIVTLYGYFNYGNRFQNYAVQEILRKYGYATETIVVYPNYKQSIKNIVYRLLSLLGLSKANRFVKFYEFSKRNIPVRFIIRKNMRIPTKIASDYCGFVTGSDQVWNPLIRKKERDNFFLRFAEKKQRICISPSFGVSEIEEKYRADYIDGLNGFKYLCSREQTGVDIIYTLTGRKADLLVDPTLALDADSWRRISVQPSITTKRYILVAMLGMLDDNKSRFIEQISTKHKLELINVFDERSVYAPDEVLWLIDHASLVFTDSFHFTAFSINFSTPFIVTQRKTDDINSATYSRIASLLSLFHLEGRAFEHVEDCDDVLTCDYSLSCEVLDQERIKFFNYIEGGLDSIQ